MTFPWKKVKKNTRISQLLSNQIHHRRKDGGSPLVVETGFPTSLIDLFVKNKERLKRQSKKNSKTRRPPPPPPPPSHNDDVNDSLLSVASSPPLPSLSASPLRHHQVRDVCGVMSDGIGAGECRGTGQGEEGVAANGVLVAMLRMFLVVVLVLGTKKFVVGITMSAFLLVFLEYVGKHASRLSGPCTGIKEKLRLIMRCTKGNIEEADNEIRQERLSLASGSGLMNRDEDQGMSNLNQEIECSLVRGSEEIECEEEGICGGINTNSGKGKGGLDSDPNEVVVLEEGNSCENGELSRRKSCGAKIKLKMKELVPMKLRTRRKKDRGLENEASHFVADGVVIFKEEEQDPKGDPREFKFDSVSSSMSREMDDGKDMVGSDQLLEGSAVDTISLKDKETKIEQNFGYVVLVLIVLFGLVGGRILALMLTLTWCLMQKSGETLRRYIKVPFVLSSVKESS